MTKITPSAHARRRADLRSLITESLTAQERDDGAGAVELSHILDQAATAITNALLPREAHLKPQERVVLGARLLARGLDILADRLEAESAERTRQVGALVAETLDPKFLYVVPCIAADAHHAYAYTVVGHTSMIEEARRRESELYRIMDVEDYCKNQGRHVQHSRAEQERLNTFTGTDDVLAYAIL